MLDIILTNGLEQLRFLTINFLNLFSKLTIRGTFLERAVIISQWLMGFNFHNDLNAFLQFTQSDCTNPLFNNQRGDP